MMLGWFQNQGSSLSWDQNAFRCLLHQTPRVALVGFLLFVLSDGSAFFLQGKAWWLMASEHASSPLQTLRLLPTAVSTADSCHHCETAFRASSLQTEVPEEPLTRVLPGEEIGKKLPPGGLLSEALFRPSPRPPTLRPVATLGTSLAEHSSILLPPPERFV
ncbi:MAG: hypothetical protein AAF191_15855 [Verrucomicrobiota bacterium]